jgi:hypothetical protein
MTTKKSTETGLTFPHPELTVIHDKPTYDSVRRLEKELYANAQTIPSLLGGGQHGHLGVVMPAAEYLVISAVAYVVPVHPGTQPVHPANSTAAQMNEANRQYDNSLTQVALHLSVVNALRQQIMGAIDTKYLIELEHPDLGFIASPHDMLEYLKTTYGDITPDDIDKNSATLTAPWNPDDPIQDLWLRIRDAQVFATRANEPIGDDAAIRHTLKALEASGVFTFALDNWRLKDDATKTMASFKEHFTKEDKERGRKLTAQTGGYHGANAADSGHPPSTPATPTPPSAHVNLGNGVKMYYCWSHGLGKNKEHTSPMCNFKKDGHVDTATANNMQGGCNLIAGPRPHHEHPPPASGTTPGS